MGRETLIWNLMAKRYSKQPIADQAAYEKKLEITRRYFTPESEVLEFGCGTGTTALLHAPFVKHIDATDFSENMIAIAEAKRMDQGIGNVKFEVRDINTLPTSDKQYDVVLGLNIVHLLANKEAVFAKIHQLLKPGGYFISSSVCFTVVPFPFNVILSSFGFLGLFPKLKGFSEDELLGSVKAANFTVVEKWNPASKKMVVVFLVAQKNA